MEKFDVIKVEGNFLISINGRLLVKVSLSDLESIKECIHNVLMDEYASGFSSLDDEDCESCKI